MKHILTYNLFESKSDDDTLFIFDFDDTIVDSPRFEELAINYLRENVTTKTLVNRSLKQIGKKKEDIKIENGRLYVNDPNSEIEVTGDWVRKKDRVYMVAPDKFYYLEESFPDKLTKLSAFYKKVKNKAIVTARIKTVRKLVEKYLDKLELGQPNHGLFMYPLKDETPDRVATWKAKTVIKLIKDSGFTKAEFFDDKSKTVNAVVKAVKEQLPDVEFIGHKVKSPEMTYLNEELDFFNKFITKYDKSNFISRTDSHKLSLDGLSGKIFQKLEKDIDRSLKVLNKIDNLDVEELLQDIDVETIISPKDSHQIVKWIKVITKPSYLGSSSTGISNFRVNINPPETYSNRITSLTNRILKDILEKVVSGKSSELDSLSKHKNDYFSKFCYLRLKQSDLFNNIKLMPEIQISYELPTNSLYSKDISDIKSFIEEEVVKRLFTINDNYIVNVSGGFGRVDIFITLDINYKSLQEELLIEFEDREGFVDEIKDIFIDEIVDVWDIEELPADLEEDEETPGIFYDFNDTYLALDLDKPYLEILMWCGYNHYDRFEQMTTSLVNFIERVKGLGYEVKNQVVSDYILDADFDKDPFQIRIFYK